MPPSFRPITFSFPDFETFSDDELNIGLGFRDGKWSRLIKGAMQKFGATQLELNAPWASMPRVWSCPACGRKKAEVLRVTAEGVLVAKLEKHHDHLSDYLTSEMDKRFGKGWPLGLRVGDQGHVAGSVNALLRRFDDTLICADCNAADGLAKSRLKGTIDPDFTFRPSELRLFIESIPNRTHSINTDRAIEVWEAAAADFAKRKEMVGVLLDLAMVGGLKRLDRPASAFPFDGRSLVMQMIGGSTEDYAFINSSLLHVELRSQSRPALANKKRRTKHAPPTADVLSRLAAAPDSRDWAEAQNDWKCPACHRTRNEIPRKSKRGGWIAQTCRHVEYVTVGDDPSEPADDFSGASRFVERHRHILICRDCADIESRLKRDRPDLALSDSFLTVAEIASVISASANVAHEVAWDRAAELAVKNKAWIEAITEYRSEFDQAKVLWRYRAQIDQEYGGDEESRFDLLIRRVQQDYEGWDAASLRSHVHWLLSKAEHWPGIGKTLELE